MGLHAAMKTENVEQLALTTVNLMNN